MDGEHGRLEKWLTSDTIKEKFNCGFPENWTEIVLAEGKKRLTRRTPHKSRPETPIEQMQNCDLEPIAGKSIEVGHGRIPAGMRGHDLIILFETIDLFFVSIFPESA